ncbi:hypothetical protein OIE68_45415 [Nocardia vinacea]|uniref:hypothetical protein n=1 Tax=Nocardia vinacea TaxID=96468 RepID=UPI002E15C86D|nr:hypothetical protein OIE68_45415 [Nocardia vinacea]
MTVLRSLQNQSVFVSRMLATATERQQQTGQPPPQPWFEDYHGRAVMREELSNAAYAGGVPRVWIDHVRERGDRGIGWRAELYLRAPEPTDWDRILGDLDADVQRQREWIALDAAHHTISPNTDSSVAYDVERNLRALHQRTTGVANLLGLTTEDGHQLWGDVSDWAHAAVTMLDGVPAEQLTQRWHQLARTGTRAYALQARALAEAGIPISTAAALPSHEELVPAIRAGLTLPQPLFRSAVTTGADIDTAINAANLTVTVETDSAPAEFSHAPTTELWVYDPAADIGAPQLVAPGEGFEP